MAKPTTAGRKEAIIIANGYELNATISGTLPVMPHKTIDVIHAENPQQVIDLQKKVLDKLSKPCSVKLVLYAHRREGLIYFEKLKVSIQPFY